MADIGVFPSLPGLAWNVVKTPTFQTRVQRAVSGRELRALDYPYPLWQFTLVYEFLRDSPAAGYDELRTLMGFCLQCQGAYGTFLFQDPSDYQVSAQILPEARSSLSGAPGIAAAGSGYLTGDTVSPAGGTVSTVGGIPALFGVTASGGAITGLGVLSAGSYAVIPGTTAVSLTGGSGSGATVNLGWNTTTQLVRTLGGFTEQILAPNALTSIYYNGVRQSGWSVSPLGVVTLPAPFNSPQPVIQADFSYYFRCRFIDDRQDFENFMYRLWQVKKLTFISVRP
jgi:hypothetical protein